MNIAWQRTTMISPLSHRPKVRDSPLQSLRDWRGNAAPSDRVVC
jgi:hypothetical protein